MISCIFSNGLKNLLVGHLWQLMNFQYIKTGKTLSELRQEYMEQNMDNNMVDIENINQI